MSETRTNHLGQGTRNLTVNLRNEDYEAVLEMARTSGIKMGAYVRQVLGDAVKRRLVVRQHIEVGDL
jgi:hypothetical protein